jgi:hypothetical protein
VNFVDGWQVSENDFNFGLVQELAPDQIRVLQVLLEDLKDGPQDGRVVGLGLKTKLNIFFNSVNKA